MSVTDIKVQTAGNLYATKEYIDTDHGDNYYQIYVGKVRIAEYIGEAWVDKLIAGYNKLVDEHRAEMAMRRKIAKALKK